VLETKLLVPWRVGEVHMSELTGIKKTCLLPLTNDNRDHVDINISDHKDLGNHLSQSIPQLLNHSVSI
jgi:hypothetical protein